MSDIVERLRRDADRMGAVDRINLAHEAADEIERLRAEVALWRDKWEHCEQRYRMFMTRPTEGWE